MILSLSPEAHIEKQVEPLELQPPANRKSAAVAFLLSIVVPGAGHLYLGKIKTAFWIFAFFLIGLGYLFSMGTYWLQGFLMVPSLYLFGALDSFAAAREWNAGVEGRLTGANPRIAALLNLLTKGFGYFYLGDRTKGIVVFFCVSTVQAIFLLKGNIYLQILVLSLQFALSADGYRLARQRLLSANPELAGTAIKDANLGGLPVTVTRAFAYFIVFAYVVATGFLLAINGKPLNRAGGAYDSSPDGLRFTNARLGLEFTAPNDWSLRDSKELLAQVANEDGCNAIWVGSYSLATKEGYEGAIRKELLKNHPEADISTDGTSAGPEKPQSVLTSIFVNQGSGKLLEQRLLHYHRGLRSFTLIESRMRENMACKQDFDRMESSVKIR